MPKVEVYSSAGNLMTETELDLSGLNVMTDVNVADSVLVFDASAAANKRATVEEFMDGAISTATALTSVDVADYIPLYDASATSYKYGTAENVLKGLLSTATTATIASGDYVLFRDVSNSDVLRKGLVSDIAGGFKGAAANAASQQSFSNSTYTKVTFGTEIHDSENAFSSSTYTAPRAGYLRISVNCVISSTGGATGTLVLYKNGTRVTNSARRVDLVANNAGFGFFPEWVVETAASDTWEIYVYHTSGSPELTYSTTGSDTGCTSVIFEMIG